MTEQAEQSEQTINSKAVDATLQIDSLLYVLEVYLDANSNVDKIIHASILVEKMREQVNELKSCFEGCQ